MTDYGEPLGQLGRHVLERMNREVDLARQQRRLDLFREEALAADRRQRAIAHEIAGGADGHDLDRAGRRELGMRGDEAVSDRLGLDQRQWTAARTDAEDRSHASL